jgi:hypothetical protein
VDLHQELISVIRVLKIGLKLNKNIIILIYGKNL